MSNILCPAFKSPNMIHCTHTKLSWLSQHRSISLYVFHCTTVLIHCTTILIHCTTVLIHCTTILIHCTTVLIHCTTVLIHSTTGLFYCTTLLIHCTTLFIHCTPVLIHCTTVLIHCTTVLTSSYTAPSRYWVCLSVDKLPMVSEDSNNPRSGKNWSGFQPVSINMTYQEVDQ